MEQLSTAGIVSLTTAHSVAETVSRLQELLTAKGIKLFAVVDHSGEAAHAGMEMPDTKLLIFGTPRAGTPLMLAAPSTALDLPLKILVAEDGKGRVSISFNDPAWLQQRHGFAPELVQNIVAVKLLAEQAAS
ncbi:DUF302 domain-containing protein [Acidobacteria bacterium AB60]|nr:DUF302 domain-containing protein [Acidobacteria bacterium AB60]